MGEYAEMAMADGIDDYWGDDSSSWGWRRRSIGFKFCKACGKDRLLWNNSPPWYLTEYNPDSGNFERHTCSMKSRFKR